MPIPTDYRTLPFHVTRVGNSGRFIGRAVYWKLYAIENLMRVMIVSVLSEQLPPKWWELVAGPVTTGRKGQTISDKVQLVRRNYLQQPGRTSPGNHDIYYLFLPDLNKIIFSTKDSFRPLIPDIENWIVRFESVSLPRNIVGHMNWLDTQDRIEIDELYKDLKLLIKRLDSRIALLIP